MGGDQVYLARVTPTIENIANGSRWEFYAGGHGENSKWVAGDTSQARPLVEWKNHTGVTTMTYFAGLRKFVLAISTTHRYPYTIYEFDTYFLESDSITGPWRFVSYMSKFGPQA